MVVVLGLIGTSVHLLIHEVIQLVNHVAAAQCIHAILSWRTIAGHMAIWPLVDNVTHSTAVYQIPLFDK